MSEFKYHPYEFLNPRQLEIAPKVEELLKDLTVSEAKELLHCIRKHIEET
jgi:hypothetical protein